MTTRVEAVLNATIVCLAISAAYQFATRQAVVVDGDQPWVIGTEGPVLADVQDGAGEYQLSERLKGRCSFVVVYSATCGASRTAAVQWVETLHTDSLRSDWNFIWVQAEPSATSTATVFDTLGLSPQVGLVRASVAGDIEGELGIRAYPSHVILNRAGEYVSGDIGADVPSAASLGEECIFNVGRAR